MASQGNSKTINHVVFFAYDYVASLEFFINRLGFRYVDHSRGAGVFARADGAHEHHSIFWVSTALPMAPDIPGFMHIAFGLEDIDELMLGANAMEAKGWKTPASTPQAGSLATASPQPSITMWITPAAVKRSITRTPTIWMTTGCPGYGTGSSAPFYGPISAQSFWEGHVEWDMQFDPERKSLEPFRRPSQAQIKPSADKLPDGLEHLTAEDEHAI